MLFFYNIGIYFYRAAIQLAALFSPKAKLWVEGRKNLQAKVGDFRNKNKGQLLWVHCASLGEFEQGRPVIEQWKKEMPDWKIVVTFFSPSGFEIRKNYELADAVFYLPLDTRTGAADFIKNLAPDLVIFVKYEFWYHHLNTLQANKIPTVLISSIFKANQIFFKAYGTLHRKMLFFFDRIFVQDKASVLLLQNIAYQKVELAGDTRTDRVATIAEQKREIPIAAKFAEGQLTIVCGSTWPEDEKIWAKVIAKDEFSNIKFIFAPHEIHEAHLQELESILPVKTLRFSKGKTADLSKGKVLIIDNIGMLSALYRYGDIAYIGGGFGAGIHNTLEPAAHGLPVIFGPKYQKFAEAVQLKELRAGFPVHNEQELSNVLKNLLDEKYRNTTAQAAKQYIEDNKGASSQVISYLKNIVTL